MVMRGSAEWIRRIERAVEMENHEGDKDENIKRDQKVLGWK